MTVTSICFANKNATIVKPTRPKILRVSVMGDKIAYVPRPSRRKFDISKEELEKLVWEMPTTDIAKQLGVSDKAVEKRCKLWGIEKPPRGYWQRKRAEERKAKKSGWKS